MTRLEALKMIAARDGGVLTPAAVIDAARDEASPLHGSFTWDNTEAARKWRVLEAQRLIRSFTISVKNENDEEIVVPVFLGLSTDRDGDSEDNPYRMAEDVSRCEDMVAVAVADALDQLNAIKERYKHLKQLRAIWEAIENETND